MGMRRPSCWRGRYGPNFDWRTSAFLVAGIVLIGLPTIYVLVSNRARRWCAPAATSKRRSRPPTPSISTCHLVQFGGGRAIERVGPPSFTNTYIQTPRNTGGSTASASASNSSKRRRRRSPPTQTRPQQRPSSRRHHPARRSLAGRSRPGRPWTSAPSTACGPLPAPTSTAAALCTCWCVDALAGLCVSLWGGGFFVSITNLCSCIYVQVNNAAAMFSKREVVDAWATDDDEEATKEKDDDGAAVMRRPVERTVRGAFGSVRFGVVWWVSSKRGDRLTCFGLWPRITVNTDAGQPPRAVAPHRAPPPDAQGDGYALLLFLLRAAAAYEVSNSILMKHITLYRRAAGGQPRAGHLRLVAPGGAGQLGALPRGLAKRPGHGGL